MLMEAINTLLGANVFDGYIADGHDVSWEE